MNLNDLISQAQAARDLGVSRARINQWISEGRLDTFQIGGKPLVSKSQVAALDRPPAGRPKTQTKRKAA